MIRFISPEVQEKSKQQLKKGLIQTLSVAMVISPMVAFMPTAAHATANTFAAPLPAFLASGDGESELTAYVIMTPDDLNYISTAPDKFYKLGANINLAGYEWTPLAYFTGTLDGQGHYIQNLTIITYSYNVGFFGIINSTGVVRNLGIQDASFTIPMEGRKSGNAGILVGANSGSIENCHVTGKLSVSGIDLPGYYGSVSRNDGGLVGYNVDDASILNSFAQVDVAEDGYAYYDRDRIGGLVGLNEGAITNSYSVGAVIDNVGNYYYYEKIGGLVGDNDTGYDGSVTNSFWDSSVLGAGLDNEVGTPKSTTDMKTKAIFTAAGWDFDSPNSVWNIIEGKTYPFLRVYEPTVPAPVQDQTLSVTNSAYGIDLTSSFADPTNDQLTIEASSSNDNVISVHMDNVNRKQLWVTPGALGTATVTLTATNVQGAVVQDSFIVSVTPASTNNTTANDVTTLGLVGTSTSSNATGVATAVISGGNVAITSVSAGSATITVTDASSHTATIAVTVAANGAITLGTITPYSVTFIAATNSTTANDVTTLGLAGTSASSSATGVATAVISGGNVAITSVSAGSATITVTDGSHTATIAITVAANGAITIGTITKYQVAAITGTVTGYVYGPSNAPLNGVNVSNNASNTTTDTEGLFTLLNVPVGNQTISVSDAVYGNGTRTVMVTAGQSVSAGNIILLMSNAQAVALDKAALGIGYATGDSASSVTQNVTLAAAGANDTTISWSSSNPTVVSETGIVNRPNGDGGTTVTLTATIQRHGVSDSQVFTLIVAGIPQSGSPSSNGGGGGSSTPTATPVPTATPAPTPVPIATPKPFYNEKVNIDVIKALVEKANSAPTVAFKDVPKDSPMVKVIELATKLGIVKGYADGSFHPNATVTRAEFATMLVKALGLESTGNSDFKDTKGHWAADAIAALKSSGIINGYADGSFKPNQSISKAEIVAMLSKVMNTTSTSNPTKFNDISGSWAEDAINTLSDSGIVKGAGDGSFKPNAQATRSESLLMIMRLLNASLGLPLDIE